MHQFSCTILTIAIFTTIAATAFSPTPAVAQDALQDWDISLGAGAVVKPDYEGADDYEIKPLPYFDIEYKELVYLHANDGIGVHLYNDHNFKLSTGLGYDFGREEDNGDRLEGLGDVDDSVEGRVMLRYHGKPLRAGIEFAHALNSGGHDGYTVQGSVGYLKKIEDTGGKMGITLRTTYASENYNQSYFGVTPTQEANSVAGLPAYEAHAGFKDVGLYFNSGTRLSEHWWLNGVVGYKKLVGDAADSPLSEEDDAFIAGLFTGYKF